jgi:hypothetical protein
MTRRNDFDAVRLIALLGMTNSAHDGEALNAARLANRLLHESGLIWGDVLNPAVSPTPQPSQSPSPPPSSPSPSPPPPPVADDPVARWARVVFVGILAAILVPIAALIALALFSGSTNQPAVPAAQQRQETQAQWFAAQAQADAWVIAHEVARPAECRDWVQPTPVVDVNGTSWLARTDLEHARRCSSWEANAAVVVAGTMECHRLPTSWNAIIGLYQDEANARARGSWCVIPANPQSSEREALQTDAERAAAR